MDESVIELKTEEPYFGELLHANQIIRDRIPAMILSLTTQLQLGGEDFKVLEIGSWAGQSTCMWGCICKKFGRGKVYCVDNWLGSENVPHMRGKKDEVIKLFRHNIRSSEVEDYIIPIQGSSDDILPILRNESFDFIYIDGDHAYSQFKRDLLNSMKLLKAGGVLCGDDYDIPYDRINKNFTEEDKEKDMAFNPDTKESYHLGVTLVLQEIFEGKVSAFCGFWAVRKLEDKWVPAFKMEIEGKKKREVMVADN